MKRRHAEGDFFAVVVNVAVAVLVAVLDLVAGVFPETVHKTEMVPVVVREMLGEQAANVVSINLENVQRFKVAQIEFLQSRRGMHRICANR